MSGMTDRERALWDAVFGAYFVREFAWTKEHGRGFDHAVASTNAEAAGTVANIAVLRYRQWRKDENDADFGERIDEAWYAEVYPK